MKKKMLFEGFERSPAGKGVAEKCAGNVWEKRKKRCLTPSGLLKKDIQGKLNE